MTYRPDCTLPNEILEQIAEQGMDILPELIRIVVNTAMQAERQQHLGVRPYERSPERKDHANGYKSKTVATRMGKITFDVPQVRQGDFYPNALEKGIRSERALKLALAEMYVQGVSTRKVAAITEQLCGFEVSSTQVSQAAALWDEQLQAWRERPLGSCPYLYPACHQRRLRTSNSVERLTREIRRRSRVATLFPNQASCLRLVTAVIMEISEEWQTGRIYLCLDPD